MEPIFKELKVLELASVLAGPSVGQFFAELGAEVIKVENLKGGGDVTRSWKTSSEMGGDLSAYFCCCNWGKKSVALDLNSVEGKSIIQQLARQADVVIASYKPGDADKLGVAFHQLQKENSRLIYGQITGYGSDQDRVGYDAVLQAETGYMDLNGEADGPPTKMPVALIDILAAHQLKEGLLLALLQRQQTSKGQLVEVSLVDAAVSSLANQATNWLMTHNLPTRKGSAHPNIAPYGEFFETQDGQRILLAIGSDKQFQQLMSILGKAEVAEQPEFVTNASRVKNRGKLREVLKELIAQHEGKSLLTEFHQHKIPAGKIQNLQEVFSMPEIQSHILNDPLAVGVRTFITHGFAKANLSRPPHFGEHTKEILSALKMR